MDWFSASEPSQKITRSGFVSRAASSTQDSIGVATIDSRKADEEQQALPMTKGPE
jgi:hypothetical protein